jgi:hypothetical protein
MLKTSVTSRLSQIVRLKKFLLTTLPKQENKNALVFNLRRGAQHKMK